MLLLRILIESTLLLSCISLRASGHQQAQQQTASTSANGQQQVSGGGGGNKALSNQYQGPLQKREVLPDDEARCQAQHSTGSFGRSQRGGGGSLNHGNGGGIIGYLLANSSASKQLDESQQIDAILSNVLDRVGPDMRPTSGFTDAHDITLNVSKRAWQLMHNHAQYAVNEKIDFAIPLVEQILAEANASTECRDAVSQTGKAAKSLQSWAIQCKLSIQSVANCKSQVHFSLVSAHTTSQPINEPPELCPLPTACPPKQHRPFESVLAAWGTFPPSGLFEGTFGDIGSFKGCINVPENEVIGHAHYCTIAYRPVMPYRRDYELLVRKEPHDLLNLFEKIGNIAGGQSEDAFTKLIDHSHYNHYIYYKFGTCFPIKCSPFDVQRIAKLLGRRAIFMSGPVKCQTKYEQDYDDIESLQMSSRDLNGGVYIWKPRITLSQRVALTIVGSLLGLSFMFTLIDLIFRRAPKMWALLSEDPIPAPSDNNRQQSKGELLVDLVRKFKLNRLVKILHSAICSRSINSDDEVVTTTATMTTNECDINMIQLDEGKLATPLVAGACDDQLKDQLTKRLMNDVDLQSKVSADNARSVNNLTKSNVARSNRSWLIMDLIGDCSIVTNTTDFFLVTDHQLKTDILCLNGLRCITMCWIIIAHTMQYNDWSAFARTFEVETHLKSLINQPLFNGSYLVDTFFLVSGLLTAFSSFKISSKLKRTTLSNNNNCCANNGDNQSTSANGHYRSASPQGSCNTCKSNNQILKQILEKFSLRTYLIGRYLRLTPQILLTSLLFILLPLLSSDGSPHWQTMTSEFSENCSNNWWINLLHIQAFYNSSEMCNYVCWWISVDMFYHLFALIIILIILKFGHKLAVRLTLALISVSIVSQASKHYGMGLPPNILSTIPQTGAMWTEMTLNFFWTPFAHTFPFIFGFYLGYLMAQHPSKLRNWFTIRRALCGWFGAITALGAVSYGTYFWVMGELSYTNEVATLFNVTSQIIWSLCLGWIIVACQFNYGGWINEMLSCKFFIVLGKASYLVYLTHFLILFSFFGSQNLLLEPTQVLMCYVILGNVCLSTLFGCVLCILFEMPWLKLQRRILMRYFH